MKRVDTYPVREPPGAARFMRWGISAPVPTLSSVLVPVPWDVLEASGGTPFAVTVVGPPYVRITEPGIYLGFVLLKWDTGTPLDVNQVVLFRDLTGTVQANNQAPRNHNNSTSGSIIVVADDLPLPVGAVAQYENQNSSLLVGTNLLLMRIGET